MWIVQENRSFNDMFQGYPDATTAPSGENSSGKTIKLKPISPQDRLYDIDHGATGMFAACHGTRKLPGTHCTNEGFNSEQEDGGPPNGQFVYVPHSESKPYWDMAHEFVLADHMFASQLDESFVAHQYIVAAQAQSSVNVPYGPWGCEGGNSDLLQRLPKSESTARRKLPASITTTLGDELDAAKLPWRFYTSAYTQPLGGFWSGYQAVKHIFEGPDWKKDVITPQKRFLTEIKKGDLAASPGSRRCARTPTILRVAEATVLHGSLPWSMPSVKANFGIPPWFSCSGTIGAASTIRFPRRTRDYDGLGFRVGLMVISAYAKKNYVSHVQYETASVLRYGEDLFGLPQLSDADTRATSPAADCLDFSQKPRTFVPIKAPKGPDFFLRQPLDPRIPDSDF